MQLTEFLDHYESATGNRRKKVGADSYNINCSVHPDTIASLTVSRGRGNPYPNVVLHCHAGCDWEDIARSVGLKPQELYDPSVENREAKILAVYPYYDEDGTLLYEMVRFEGKKLRPRRPMEDGNYAWSVTEGEHYQSAKNGDWYKTRGEGWEKGRPTRHIGGVKRVPYNLPELIKRKNELVVIAAGEKDADALMRHGILATTNTFGEGSWSGELNKYFAGMKVVIIFDNDKTGREHAEYVKNSLKSVAASVRIVDLEVNKEKGDFYDWIEEHEIEEFLDKIYGTNLPNARLAETTVLGAIFKNNKYINAVIQAKAKETFFVQGHKFILDAMFSCVSKNLVIDVVTVGQELGEKLIPSGGYDYLYQLQREGQVLEEIDSYLTLIKDKWEIRELVKLADKIVSEAPRAKDVKNLKGSLASQLISISPQKSKSQSAREVATDFLLNYDKQSQGIPTGFRDFDKITKGLHKSNLIVIAAVEKAGKTTFTLNIADNIATAGKNVLYFSMEMSKVELIKKLIATRAFVDLSNIISGELTPEELIRIHSTYTDIPDTLHIDDTPALSLIELRAKIDDYVNEHGSIDLIVVDYLQLMVGKGETRQQEVSSISRGLKAIAKDYECAVIAISQLSRPPETRLGQPPINRDLRDSGAIAQDLDVLAFVHRKEVFDPSPDNYGVAQLILSGRSVKPGVIDLGFIGEYSVFQNVILS